MMAHAAKIHEAEDRLQALSCAHIGLLAQARMQSGSTMQQHAAAIALHDHETKIGRAAEDLAKLKAEFAPLCATAISAGRGRAAARIRASIAPPRPTTPPTSGATASNWPIPPEWASNSGLVAVFKAAHGLT